jgi:hypothetical protein
MHRSSIDEAALLALIRNGAQFGVRVIRSRARSVAKAMVTILPLTVSENATADYAEFTA